VACSNDEINIPTIIWRFAPTVHANQPHNGWRQKGRGTEIIKTRIGTFLLLHLLLFFRIFSFVFFRVPIRSINIQKHFIGLFYFYNTGQIVADHFVWAKFKITIFVSLMVENEFSS
jgi:hypothetical protein